MSKRLFPQEFLCQRARYLAVNLPYGSVVRRQVRKRGQWQHIWPQQQERQSLVSTRLKLGVVYSRESLAELFDIIETTLKTGVFRPKSYDSLWLFVTRIRPPNIRTSWPGRSALAGQTSDRTYAPIIEHAQRGLELLLFNETGNTSMSVMVSGTRDHRYESHQGGHLISSFCIMLLSVSMSRQRG